MVAVAGAAIVTVSNTAGNFRTIQTSTAVGSSPAGSSITITVTQTSGGVLPQPPPSELYVDVLLETGVTPIITFTLIPVAASQTAIFRFTTDGAGGDARCGTLRLRIRSINTTSTGGTYNVNSDGTGNTPPTGSTATTQQGYLLGTTTATTVLAASSDPSPTCLAFGNTVTATTTLGAIPYDSRTLSITFAPLTATSSSASATAQFVTALGTVDKRFGNALATDSTVTSFPVAALTGVPWTAATIVETSRQVDPRFTKLPLLQVKEKTYGTPPNVKDVGPPRNRLVSDLGFLGTRYRNANNAGINSLSTHHVLADQFGLVATITWDDTTSTQGGEDGWTGPALKPWDSQLPSGKWTHTTTVTSPSNAMDLETGADTVNLVSRNFNAVVVAVLSVSNEADHAHPGDTLTASMYAYTSTSGVRIAPDDGTVKFSLTRLNRTTGLMEALNTDLTTWSAWTTGVRPSFALIASTVDPTLFQLALPATSDWGVSDIVEAQAVCVIGGGTYVGMVPRELLSAAANGHGKYKFDGGGFVGYPSK